MDTTKEFRVFHVPQQFPCGPQSSCCGPVGQTEEDVNSIIQAIEQEFYSPALPINAQKADEMKNHLPIVQLIQSFGLPALPIVTLDGEVLSMGTCNPEELISAIKEKFNA